MEFTERLLTVMSHYGHNKNSFSIAIGSSNNTVIGRLVNETGRRPSFELIEMIMKKFPAINPTWLIIGEGEMFTNRPDFLPAQKDRLMKICELLKLSAFQFADAAQISKPEAIEIIEGKKEPSKETMNRIAKSFPMINENWIISNHGSIFKENVHQELFVPYFEDIPAGTSREDLKHLPVSFTVYNTRIVSAESQDTFGIRNQSNEFSPLISSGDYLTIKLITTHQATPSDLVFISTKKRNFVRKVAKYTENSYQYLPLIDNSGIAYEIQKADITIIGLVSSVYRIIS